MFRFLVRSLGFLSLACGLGAIAIDAARSIAASALILTELGGAWSALDPASLSGFRHFVETILTPSAGAGFADPLLAWILAMPLSVALTTAGFVLILLGAPRRRSAPAEALTHR